MYEHTVLEIGEHEDDYVDLLLVLCCNFVLFFYTKRFQATFYGNLICGTEINLQH